MQFQFDIASSAGRAPGSPFPPAAETVPELLRQILEHHRDQLQQIIELQREHLHHVRMVAQENLGRWRQLLGRWEKDMPQFAGHCMAAYPVLEKAYVELLDKMVQEVCDQDEDTFDNEFAMQEFIDRFGMRVSQFSHLMSVVSPLNEAAHQLEQIRKQQQQQQTQQAQG